MARRSGFTLVELLVVIAIIGILVALLLPAVQAAREAARRTQCKNQMRQMALASLNHHDVVGHMPTSGWGWRWQPDPSRGLGVDQPGGWTFNILPFIEEQSLRDAASGGGSQAEVLQKMTQLVQTPIPVYNCPSRREPTLYLFETQDSNAQGRLALNLSTCISRECSVARTDYAGNAGNGTVAGDLGNTGPTSLAALTVGYNGWITDRHNGVIYQRSVVRISKITDGTSKTALAGEKYVSTDNYSNGASNGDDQNIFVGHDFDNIRYTGLAVSYDPNNTSPVIGAIGPMADTAGLYPVGTNRPATPTTRLPFQTGFGTPAGPIFGSAHPGSLNMAFCDGSVQSISYDVDPQVYYFYGGRNDDGGVYGRSLP